MKKNILLMVVLVSSILMACKKESEELKMTAISEYAPYAVGKYITYQLDSFRYLPFSTRGITITYQVKYLVDAVITDNLGRPAYRIFRYIRKNANDTWKQDNTVMAINTGTSLEFIENNLRFISLQQPIRQLYSWMGNSYINTSQNDPAEPDFKYLEGWEYMYDSVNAPLKLGNITLDSTLKVAQRDENIGTPGFYNEVNFGVEYYAKGIGLVYKKLLHTEYQPPAGSGSGYYSDASKGITFTMIDHN